MSRITISSGERVEATKRRSMTKARRRIVEERSAGHCAYPGCLVSSHLEIDHVIALELGGRDDDENLVALCREHHRQKSVLDMKLIAKARRIIARQDGTRRPRKPIPGRPFGKQKHAWPTRRFMKKDKP
jgi:5-methylcytosine-specific restriction enzyme A